MSDMVPRWYTTEDTPAGRRWVYPAPKLGYDANSSTLASPGGQVENHHGWIVADHELSTLTYRDKGKQRVVKWRLKSAGAASSMFPAEVTAEEWDSRCTGRGVDDCQCPWCSGKWSLYEAIREDVPGVLHTLDYANRVHLGDGGIDRDHAYVWASGPSREVLYGSFVHLKPGLLLHARSMLKEALEKLDNVDKVYDTNDAKLSVYVLMAWDEPWTEHRPRHSRTGRQLKGTRPVTIRTITVTYDINCPPSIPGDTKAEAVVEFENIRDRWVQFFTDAQVKACSHCKGYGYIEPRPGGAA